MNMLKIDLYNGEHVTDPAELREALQRANKQIVALGTQLDQLTRGCHALTTELAVMCEAQLAGDSALVNSIVTRFTGQYQKTVKPAGRSVH